MTSIKATTFKKPALTRSDIISTILRFIEISPEEKILVIKPRLSKDVWLKKIAGMKGGWLDEKKVAKDRKDWDKRIKSLWEE